MNGRRVCRPKRAEESDEVTFALDFRHGGKSSISSARVTYTYSLFEAFIALILMPRKGSLRSGFYASRRLCLNIQIEYYPLIIAHKQQCQAYGPY